MTRNILRQLTTLIISILFCLSLQAKEKGPKYIFYFIGDGMSQTSVYATSIFNKTVKPDGRSEAPVFTTFPISKFITSYSASSLVTDSAAAGTGLATGCKTRNYGVGVDKDIKRVKNIAELLSETGRKVAIITNVGINHATPSAFYAHNRSRSKYKAIISDLIDSPTDFIAGSTILARSRDSVTVESEIERVVKGGFYYTQKPEEAAKITGKRVMLLSDELDRENMRYSIDSPHKNGHSHLTQYCRSAIDYLEANQGKEGFFLMCEGGKIDYAHHDNDAAGGFYEINEFSDCVSMAVEFMKKHPKETLIVVTSDHETGGMAIGFNLYKMEFDKLAWQNISEEELTDCQRRMQSEGRTSWEDVKDLLSQRLGFWSHIEISEAEEAKLKEAYKSSFSTEAEGIKGFYSINSQLSVTAIEMLNEKAWIKWASRHHTGAQVPLFVAGAGCMEFVSCSDQTDVPRTIAKLLGKSLN